MEAIVIGLAIFLVGIPAIGGLMFVGMLADRRVGGKR
jgi:hypothetical protein